MEKNQRHSRSCLIDGVFDMFHIGHLSIIERVKQDFDNCLVGLNNDAFVELFKGRAPVIPFGDRRKIVESIRYVDGVVPMDGEHCYTIEFLKKHGIDVLAHGTNPSAYCNRLYAPLLAAGMYVEYEETPHIHTSVLVEICRSR